MPLGMLPCTFLFRTGLPSRRAFYLSLPGRLRDLFVPPSAQTEKEEEGLLAAGILAWRHAAWHATAGYDYAHMVSA